MSYSQPLTNVMGMTALKVENLSSRTSFATLKHEFEDYGTVCAVHIPQNPLTKEPYSVAIINFQKKCDAERAMNALNGILLDGCKLQVQMAHNSDPLYSQPSCRQGGQYRYKEKNHEFQSDCERHACHTTRTQSRSHTWSFPDQSESTKRSKSNSSLSSHQLKDKPCPKASCLCGAKEKKPKSRPSHKHDFKSSETRGKKQIGWALLR